MPTYRFTGNYQTFVTLMDGTVRLTDVGEVVTLPGKDPGPLWEPHTPTKAEQAKAAKAAAANAPAEPTPATPPATPEGAQK